MKFAFHMPTYRQQDWFAQCGWFPSRSTVNDLINYGVDTIDPLYQQMWHLLLAQPILLGDDTTLRVLLRGALSEEELAQLGPTRSKLRQALDTGQPLDTGPPGSATSYAWLYTGLDGAAPYNVFHWSLTHQNAVIDTHLATYRGIFVGDACGANARLEQRSEGRIVHASCNVHARREFIEAESNDPILASQALSFYRQLYDVEERAKTLDAAAPAEPCGSATPCRSGTACAAGWTARRCAGVAQESDRRSGRLPAESVVGLAGVPAATAEFRSTTTNRSRRFGRSTVGRSNWLFLGHPHAAPGRLQLYSIVSSAHRHHLVIDDYLEDVLAQARRCPAEPSCGPGTRLAVPAGSSAGPLGGGASSVRASGAHRGERGRLRREAGTPRGSACGGAGQAGSHGRIDRILARRFEASANRCRAIPLRREGYSAVGALVSSTSPANPFWRLGMQKRSRLACPHPCHHLEPACNPLQRPSGCTAGQPESAAILAAAGSSYATGDRPWPRRPSTSS